LGLTAIQNTRHVLFFLFGRALTNKSHERTKIAKLKIVIFSQIMNSFCPLTAVGGSLSISFGKAMIEIGGISVPDNKMTRKITELVRDTEYSLSFNHSSRVYYFGVLAGNGKGSGLIRSCCM
jgi:hypothetical protein